MKIAYTRFNNAIELDYDHSSVSTKGTDRRVGIFNALKDQGHEIHIYGIVKEADKKPYINPSLFGEKTLPFQNIKIMPNNSFPKTEDVLLIENGTTNTMFSYNDNGITIPFIKRTFDIIDKWSGKIVYLQWDADLPFPFGESNAIQSEGVSDRNLTKMGNAVDMFTNKTWRVLTTALNAEELKRRYDCNRCRYSEFVTDIISIPLCYSPESDLRFSASPNPKYDSIYIGTESDSYRNKLLSNYINTKKTCLIGKWSDEVLTKYLPYVQYGNVVEGHSNVYKLYNSAYTTVQCGEKGWVQLDHMTSRFFQALGGGCIPLLIDSYSNEFVSTYLPNNTYHIKSKEKYNEIVSEILSWTKEQRDEQISKIVLHNKKWVDLNWELLLL